MLKSFPSRKEKIILAAIEIIGEKGIQGLSSKEIAAKQGISESVLYKHFKSLDDVLVAAIEHFAQFDVMIINTLLDKDLPCKEKILAYCKSFLELYESHPALVAIVLNYEALINYDHTKAKITNIIKMRSEFVVKVAQRGQESGELEKYYTPQELDRIVVGCAIMTILEWKMSGFGFPLKNKALLTIKKILDRI